MNPKSKVHNVPYLLSDLKGKSISVQTSGGREYLEELSTDDWYGPDPDHEAKGYQADGARKVVHVNGLPSKCLLAEAADHHVSTQVGIHIRLKLLSSTNRLVSCARFVIKVKSRKALCINVVVVQLSQGYQTAWRIM